MVHTTTEQSALSNLYSMAGCKRALKRVSRMVFIARLISLGLLLTLVWVTATKPKIEYFANIVSNGETVPLQELD